MTARGLLGRMLLCSWILLVAIAAAAQEGPILFGAGSADDEPAAPAGDRAPVHRPNTSPAKPDRDNWPLDQPGARSKQPSDPRGAGSPDQEREKKYREWLNSRQNQHRTEPQQRTGTSGLPSQRDPWPQRRDAPSQGGSDLPSQDRSSGQGPSLLNRAITRPSQVAPGSTSGRAPTGKPLLRNWGDERSTAPGAQASQRPAMTPPRGAQSWQRPTQPYQRGGQQSPNGLQPAQSGTQPQQRSVQPWQRGWQSPQYNPSPSPAPSRVTPRGPAAESVRRQPTRDELWSDSSNQRPSQLKRSQQPGVRNDYQRASQPGSLRTGSLGDGATGR